MSAATDEYYRNFGRWLNEEFIPTVRGHRQPPVTHSREGTYCFRCGHWLWPEEGCRKDRPSPAAAASMQCEAERSVVSREPRPR